MKKLSILFATLILTFVGAAQAGDILLKEADSDFVVQSLLVNGRPQDIKKLELTDVDVRQGMMYYSFAGRNFTTACRGIYYKTQNPFSKIFASNKVIGLRCVTQNGKFVVNYEKAH